MFIYFLRHASAGKSLKSQARDDRRPLDEEGIQQSTMMGRTLAGSGVQVDEVISSPLKRAIQTASLVANELGFDGKIAYSPVLAGGGDFEKFRLLLRKCAGRDGVMVVGHNPSLSQFLSLLLTSGATDKATDLKKGAVARVEIDAQGRALLHWCLTPKLVDSIYESVISSSRPKTSRK